MTARSRTSGWVERRMTATCTVTDSFARSDRDTAVDATTLAVTPATPVETYAGPCSIGPVHGRQSQFVRDGDRLEADVDAVVSFPLGSDVRFGARVEIVTCPDDAAMVGKAFTIRKIRDSSRRSKITCEAVELQG